MKSEEVENRRKDMGRLEESGGVHGIYIGFHENKGFWGANVKIYAEAFELLLGSQIPSILLNIG